MPTLPSQSCSGARMDSKERHLTTFKRKQKKNKRIFKLGFCQGPSLLSKAPPKFNTLCNLMAQGKHHPECLGCVWKGRREGVGFWKIKKKVAKGGALACHVSVTEPQ